MTMVHDWDVLQVRPSAEGEGKRVGGSSGMFPLKLYSKGDRSPWRYEKKGLSGIAKPLFP